MKDDMRPAPPWQQSLSHTDKTEASTEGISRLQNLLDTASLWKTEHASTRVSRARLTLD